MDIGMRQETPTTYPARIVIRHNDGRLFAERRYAVPKVGKVDPTHLFDFLLSKGMPCGGCRFQTDSKKVLDAWNITCAPDWRVS